MIYQKGYYHSSYSHSYVMPYSAVVTQIWARNDA